MSKLNILLDLDQTLIYSNSNNKNKHDFIVKFDTEEYYVRKRPGLDIFLKYCFDNFKTVSVWSAGEDNYVKQIVSNIFGNRNPHILWSRNTTETFNKHVCVKPLKKVFINYPEMNHTNTLILDDNPTTAVFNKLNWIRAECYSGEQDDIFLYNLILYLNNYIKSIEDVRYLPQI